MDEPALETLSAPALAAVVRDLRALLTHAEARIAALEADVAARRGAGPPAKTPANSSVPPATGWQARRPRPPAAGERPKRGPRFGHAGVSRRRALAEQIAVVLPCRPSQCRGCGATRPRVGGRVGGRRQGTDRPPVRPVVIEAPRLRVRCRHCGHGTVGQYPVGFGTTGAFGPRLVASAALLHEEHHVASARLVALVSDRVGLSISEGALVEAVGRLGQALRPAAEAIAAAVRAAPARSAATAARTKGAPASMA